MKRWLVSGACAAGAAASFAFCWLVVSKASGLHELATDGRHIFDASALTRDRALVGMFVSAFCFGAIMLAQIPRKSRSQVAPISLAFMLMSVVAVALSVSTYRQFL